MERGRRGSQQKKAKCPVSTFFSDYCKDDDNVVDGASAAAVVLLSRPAINALAAMATTTTAASFVDIDESILPTVRSPTIICTKLVAHTLNE